MPVPTSEPLKRDIPSEIRRAVEVEAAFRCAICKETSTLSLHHIIPFAAGGRHTHENLILLCAVCHGRCDKGEIGREDLRAVKRNLGANDRTASLNSIELKEVIQSLFNDLLREVQPSLERLKLLASHRNLSVGQIVDQVYGAQTTSLLLAALHDGDHELLKRLFLEKINQEDPIQTVNAKMVQPLAFLAMHLRQEGSKDDPSSLATTTDALLFPCGDIGALSLSSIMVLSTEVPDHYMSIPFIKLHILEKVSINLPAQSIKAILDELSSMLLVYQSRVSDVSYDYVYFHRFTSAGVKLCDWLTARNRSLTLFS